MKMIAKFKTIAIAAVLGAFTFACGHNTGTETPIGEPQVEEGLVQEPDLPGREEYDEFHGWITTNATRVDEVTEEEFVELREEYKRKEFGFDEAAVNWDDETRKEWEEAKAEWHDFEAKVQERLGPIEDIDVDVDVQNE